MVEWWESEWDGVADFAFDLHEKKLEQQYARENFRKEKWVTRDKKKILISKMEDSHLWNAYKYSQDEILFREMVLRLFEQRMK